MHAILLQDQDAAVRERTAKCLTLVVRKPHGVKKLLQCGTLPVLLDLLQDPNLPVRCVATTSPAPRAAATGTACMLQCVLQQHVSQSHQQQPTRCSHDTSAALEPKQNLHPCCIMLFSSTPLR